MSYQTRRYTAEYWDHRRDHEKHDRLPHRLDRKISTAIDIVMAIRVMDNVEDAAALIDDYAANKASEQRLEAVAAGAGA
ncbi:hypothetical protein IVB43_23745 [Bradyrhizobium sp. 48]|uniref:hypothetical protein n=1 Tax=Bradyrhizobium sp. 48 TaxID=2782676 RepID=UPI001FFBDC97|nr:hypothetical protein [Bradyrhizobium sp. 48]MCK1445402.1 hypothetical protein [Bradyrhizobium sp. 48]